ncbi:MAG: hypothetical protein ACT4PZ_10115 [Panacagrimonas sp.]
MTQASPQNESTRKPAPRAAYAVALLVALASVAGIYYFQTSSAPVEIPFVAAPLSPAGERPASAGLELDAAPQPSKPSAPAIAEDDDIIVDESVYEAELAERYDDPYEIQEFIDPPDETGRVHAGKEPIHTAAEDEDEDFEDYEPTPAAGPPPLPEP